MLTSRIDQLKKQFFTHVPAVCLEGALSKTHVFKETEGEPMIVRRAKAFKRHCETKTITIQPGDRIAQLMVLPILRPTLTVVEELDETERGAGGFGSTGR